MKKIKDICKRYNIAICYIFGSQKEIGKELLEGKKIGIIDVESDIDFAVLFISPPGNPLETYARLSLDLQILYPHLRQISFFCMRLTI